MKKLFLTAFVLLAFVFVTHAQTKHTIGENFGGGIVFYVDKTGEHGLIYEKQERMEKRGEWKDAAAFIADPNNHSEEGKVFTDWYLPSVTEFEEIFNLIEETAHKRNIRMLLIVKQDFRCINYWCSDENNAYGAYYFNMSIGSSLTKLKTEYLGILSIRKF